MAMQKFIRETGVLIAILVLCGSSCDELDSTNTITGVWRSREIYAGNSYRTYNVSMEHYDQLDSTSYIIYNLYNLGLEVETYVQLNDTIFNILGCNSDSYIISGKGYFHPLSFTIDWEYSVSGIDNDPFVMAHFEKP
jgi:hypothetical protein